MPRKAPAKKAEKPTASQIKAELKLKEIERKLKRIALTNRAYQWNQDELREFMARHELTDQGLADILNKSSRAVKYWKSGEKSIDPAFTFYLKSWAAMQRLS